MPGPEQKCNANVFLGNDTGTLKLLNISKQGFYGYFWYLKHRPRVSSLKGLDSTNQENLQKNCYMSKQLNFEKTGHQGYIFLRRSVFAKLKLLGLR